LSDDENCTWEKFLALDEKESAISNMQISRGLAIP